MKIQKLVISSLLAAMVICSTVRTNSAQEAETVTTGVVRAISADGTIANRWGTFKASGTALELVYGGGGYRIKVDGTPVDDSETVVRYRMEMDGRTVKGGDFEFIDLTADGLLFEVRGTWMLASNGQTIPDYLPPFRLLLTTK